MDITINPPPSSTDATPELLAFLYEYKNDETTRVLHRNRLYLLKAILEDLTDSEYLKYKDQALDIGCNAGISTYIICQNGFSTVLGVDIDDSHIEKAKHNVLYDKSKIRFDVINAENSTNTSAYNLILCMEVLEHVDNPTKVLDKIKSSLSDDGIIIISLPNKISLPYLLKIILYKLKGEELDGDTKMHLQYPFWDSLRLINDDRFVIIKKYGSNLFLTGPIIKYMKNKPIFSIVNSINYHLSRSWPFYYFSQFFFIVRKNRNNSNK